MKIQDRDVTLIRDVALSHVMSRDQLAALYFGSVCRCNTRLRGLVSLGFLKRLETPFFRQSLYMAGRKAKDVVGPQIERLLTNRAESPRFTQHALAVVQVRLVLLSKNVGQWRFEQQVSLTFAKDREYELRPDGMFLTNDLPLLIEVDMGHAGGPKVSNKLRVYQAFVKSGLCQDHFGTSTFRLLVVTTGKARASHLCKLMPQNPAFEAKFTTFDELGVPRISSWS